MNIKPTRGPIYRKKEKKETPPTKEVTLKRSK